jgi:hypothetical protein
MLKKLFDMLAINKPDNTTFLNLLLSVLLGINFKNRFISVCVKTYHIKS